MSQPSVAAYFSTRKRAASDELRNKAKFLILDQEQQKSSSVSLEKHRDFQILSESSAPLSPVLEGVSSEESSSPKILYKTKDLDVEAPILKANSAVRNIVFDVSKSGTPKTPKMNTRTRTRNRKLSTEEGQTDIRETLQKLGDGSNSDGKNVLFEKKGLLSPKKRSGTSKSVRMPKKGEKIRQSSEVEYESPAAGSITPKKTPRIEGLSMKEMSFLEIKNRINQSSRLAEIKASIVKYRNCDEKLSKLQAQNEKKQTQGQKPQIRKFQKIQLEIPVSPIKAARSPSKILMSPVKNVDLKTASPQRRLLFEPKECTPSPEKSSSAKAPAYQRYQSLAERTAPALPLPYSYRFLAEVFICIDSVAAMLFNRKETITFKKLKPAVQKWLRRNLTFDHIAQMKTIYPDAYTYSQEKIRNFGSATKQPTYDLVLTPVVKSQSERNTPDADNVLKSGSEASMGPYTLLERRRKFYNALLDKVKDEHDKFLQSFETPIVVPRQKLIRWHPHFDVENCKVIEKSELPEPPNVEKVSSAKEVLDKAKSLFSSNPRMGKALQRLAEEKMTSKSLLSPSSSESSKIDVESATNAKGFKPINISVVDTPPATPTAKATTYNSNYLTTAFKGIPKALLEKVRAKQAAKALEVMTRSSVEDKEAAMHSRIPEIARILRNIFVAEKKSVLTLAFVIQKLDNSYRIKLTPSELEEHIRLLCKIVPAWMNIRNVRMVDYLKLEKEIDMAKVIKKLESVANDKVKT